MNRFVRIAWPIAALSMVVLWCIAVSRRGVEDVRPMVAPAENVTYRGGWVDDPAARQKVLESLPSSTRYFGETPAGKSSRGGPDDVLLSDGAKKLLGKHIPARNQLDVGSCVGFATISAVEYLIALQALEEGRGPDAFRDLSTEAMYGLSRVEIGGRRIRGDGSITAWAGEAARRYGVLARDVYGPFDIRVYSTTRCRQWGNTGLPDELEPIAKQSPVRDISFVRSADEAAKAIRQGYPIAQGSQIGFGSRGPYRRDAAGFLRRSGQWGHAMACIGVIGGSRPGFLLLNSWGDRWIDGPTGGRDIPVGSFFVDWATYDAMVREGDAIVFSNAKGFPARDPWFFVQGGKANSVALGGVR